MRIFYVKRAAKDFVRLYQFIAENNEKATNKISCQLADTLEKLAQFPMLGHLIHKKKSVHLIREFITENYAVDYTIIDNEIHILRIWHSKEDRQP